MARAKDSDDTGSEGKKASKPVPRATMTIKDGERVFDAGDDVSALGADEIARLVATGAVTLE